MIGETDGNLWWLEMRERAEAKWENSLPYCDACGEKIREAIYVIDGETYCEECAEEIIYDDYWPDFRDEKMDEFKRIDDFY